MLGQPSGAAGVSAATASQRSRACFENAASSSASFSTSWPGSGAVEGRSDAFEAGLVPSFGVAARATGLSCRVKATVAGRVVVRGARYVFGGGDRASASIKRARSSARASAASAALRFTLENFCAPSRSDRCTDTPAVVWGRATAPPAAAQSPRLSQRGS